MQLFLEVWSSRFSAHPKYSGGENQETCVRLFINGDSKVDLEIESLVFKSDQPEQQFEHHIFETIEQAIDFLALESGVSNQEYQNLYTELKQKQA